MNRRHLLLIGGGVSGLLLLYCVSFGPIIYLWAKAATNDLMPRWMDDALGVVFQPHLWAMYHSEDYFAYIMWCARSGTGITDAPTWEEFRFSQDNSAR